MKNLLLNTALVCSLMFAASATFASPNSTDHSATGSKHSALGGSHLSVGTVQSAASVVAVPLIAIGSAGVGSVMVGSAAIDSAAAYEPLEITEIIITRDPSPEEAMQ